MSLVRQGILVSVIIWIHVFNLLGMDVLNDAMEMIYAGVPSSKWVSVSVEVAPSAVTVYDRGVSYLEYILNITFPFL